jgi:hypothetical protein
VGEGIISSDGNHSKVYMAPPASGASVNVLDLTFPAVLGSRESYPVDQWPRQWLATLGFESRGKGVEICTAIKALPLHVLEEAVPDGEEGQQLLLRAQQQQDLNISLQVCTHKLYPACQAAAVRDCSSPTVHQLPPINYKSRGQSKSTS